MVNPALAKDKNPDEKKKSPISSEDFAAKITKRVNKSVVKSEVKKESTKKPVVPKKEEKVSINTNEYITDDQFFDDFFSDE